LKIDRHAVDRLRREHCLQRVQDSSHCARVDFSDTPPETRQVDRPQLVKYDRGGFARDRRRNPKAI
jgi:hypothetical protein